ncbi:aldehyde dehydrogenase family protein [Cupriavidus basilensis]
MSSTRRLHIQTRNCASCIAVPVGCCSGCRWRAQPRWAATSLEERGDHLRKIAVVLRENAEELAALLTLEQGRPTSQTRAEVMRAASLARGDADNRHRRRAIT